MKKILFFIMASMVILMTGCDKKEMQETVPDEISIAPESKAFGSEGGNVDVIVTSSGEWTLSGDYEWVQPDIKEGKDGDLVRFKVESNETQQKLTAEYVFTTGTAEAKFVVTCDAGEEDKPAEESISLFPESFGRFSPEGSTESLMVTSSTDWTLAPDGECDWVVPSSLSGKDGDQVDFEVLPNDGENERSIVFIFKAGDADARITVAQDAMSYSMELGSPAEEEVPQAGGEIAILLKVSNISDKDIECSIEGSDWLHHVTTIPDQGTLKVVLNADENTGYEARSSSVSLTGPGNTSVTVAVTQAQKDRLETTGDLVQYVGLEGGNVIIPVISNIEYTCTPSDSWITYSGKEGDNECFAIASSSEDRSGSIEFKGGDLGFTIEIHQEAKALVEQVADMDGNWAWPAWTDSSPVENMSSFTLEANIYPDFNSSRYIETIMGIEGKFLIRFGKKGVVEDNTLYVVYEGGELALKTFLPFLEGNKWYHVAVTFDKGTVTGYINGVQAQRASTNMSYVNFGVPHQGQESDGPSGQRFFWVGYSYDEGRTFDGNMSEVRIWNRALSQDEINTENHFWYVDPDSDGLVAYWKFNEQTGAMTVKDWSGYGNDMQLHAPLKSIRVSLP